MNSSSSNFQHFGSSSDANRRAPKASSLSSSLVGGGGGPLLPKLSPLSSSSSTSTFQALPKINQYFHHHQRQRQGQPQAQSQNSLQNHQCVPTATTTTAAPTSFVKNVNNNHSSNSGDNMIESNVVIGKEISSKTIDLDSSPDFMSAVKFAVQETLRFGRTTLQDIPSLKGFDVLRTRGDFRYIIKSLDDWGEGDLFGSFGSGSGGKDSKLEETQKPIYLQKVWSVYVGKNTISVEKILFQTVRSAAFTKIEIPEPLKRNKSARSFCDPVNRMVESFKKIGMIREDVVFDGGFVHIPLIYYSGNGMTMDNILPHYNGADDMNNGSNSGDLQQIYLRMAEMIAIMANKGVFHGNLDPRTLVLDLEKKVFFPIGFEQGALILDTEPLLSDPEFWKHIAVAKENLPEQLVKEHKKFLGNFIQALQRKGYPSDFINSFTKSLVSTM